ncbi:MAG: adenylyltransferase/cytidyltransferase family protein [Phycisphaerales bacterium]|nr:adenylyltransferase/cytidyltransferase family protein [Phycisphaerales bacterium]
MAFTPRPEHAGGPPSLNLAGHSPSSAKVLGKARLMAVRARARAEGLTVVQCHGCFDIVHPGHIRHLRHAKSHADILLVTITGDVEMKKGTGRPLIPEELRAENLAALDFVDWVYVEQRPTAAELLAEVQPDVYVKGREYELNNDPRFKAERSAVESHGGRVVFSSGDVIFSSTALIAALEQSTDPYHARLAQLLDKPQLEGAKLTSLIASFRGKRVTVVAEPTIDTYVLCDRPEVAGESPVMTLRPIERRTYDGAGAILCRHLAAMGASPVLVTALPPSEETTALRQRLLLDGVQMRTVNVDWTIPEKQRFLVGAQKVMKLDLVEPLTLDATQQDELIELAAQTASEHGGHDAAIIADFGLGLFSPGVTGRLCKRLRQHTGVLSGDVSGRRNNLRHMSRMDLLCPSEPELRESLRLFDEGLPTATWSLLEQTGSRAAIVSMGAEGLIGFERLPETDADASTPAGAFRSRVSGEHVPALCGHAVDPLGCGDALLATATLVLCCGGSLLAASFLGAVAAAAQAQRLGNTVVSASDLRHGVARIHASHLTYAHPETIVGRTSRSPVAARA